MKTAEMLHLLQDVIAIPSVNGSDNEAKVAEYLCEYFTNAGITARVQKIDEKHANVIAYLEGADDSQREIWNGHLDTVPYGSLDDWDTDPSKAVLDDTGEILYGRGASDMKSGLCAMVFALCEHKKSGKRTPHPILFLGTCDEEKTGLGALQIEKEGFIRNCRRILIGEPTGLKLGMAQKGCIWIALDVHGKTCHGAYPDQGCSAVEYGWRIYQRLKEWIEGFEHPLLGNSTANVTKISGGTAPNMIPETCTFIIDVRVVPGITVEAVQDRLTGIIHDEIECSSGVLKADYKIINNRRAIEINQNAVLVKKMEHCMREEAVVSEPLGINYFTDASILVRDDLEAEVLLFGPGEPDMAHKPNEYVYLEKYRKAVQIFERMITCE